MNYRMLVAGIIIAPVVMMPAIAQQGGIKRSELGRIDFPPGFITVTAIAEVSPGTCSGRHTHPGAESAYVLEGEIVIKVEGKPDQTFKAGQWFTNPPNQIHDACTVRGTKTLGTYVVKNGDPIALPAK